MRFANPYCPTTAELRAWAADPESVEPSQDWDLILSWEMDRGRLRTLVELAADPTVPQSSYCLQVLYQWVSYVAGQKDFDSRYDPWLDEARGVRDEKVKQWRHKARLIFQGIERFDYDAWWSEFRANGD